TRHHTVPAVHTCALPLPPGLVTTGFIIQDSPDQLDLPLTPEDLWAQRHFGCPEPDPGDGGLVGRSRLLHRAAHGSYGPGRHSNRSEERRVGKEWRARRLG